MRPVPWTSSRCALFTRFVVIICEVTDMVTRHASETHESTQAATLDQKKQKPTALSSAVRAVVIPPTARPVNIIRGFWPT